MFDVRWAQHRRGQKLHLVPMLAKDEPLLIALCGKHVEHWRMTINAPLAHACKNCCRVDRQNGRQRVLQLIRMALDYLDRQGE
jgi:hypothetical protein